MINPQLLEYVRQQSVAGISKEEISKSLIASGWQLSDINEAFAVSLNPQPVSPPSIIRTPVHISVEKDFAQSVRPPSHKGIWATVIVVLVLIGGAGAFAAYQYGLFSPSTPLTETPAPLPPTMPPPAELASSTPQMPPTASSSSASLDANTALTLPSANLTINNATSTIASASTFTLKWSSTNADKLSATESVSNCLISVMDKPDTALVIMTSARGTNSSISFTKNDLALLSACTVTIIYNAENTKTAQKAQAAVTITFPNNDSTVAQLINMTSLGTKSASSLPVSSAMAPVSPSSVPLPPLP